MKSVPIAATCLYASALLIHAAPPVRTGPIADAANLDRIADRFINSLRDGTVDVI